jgi:hypothetical protein
VVVVKMVVTVVMVVVGVGAVEPATVSVLPYRVVVIVSVMVGEYRTVSTVLVDGLVSVLVLAKVTLVAVSTAKKKVVLV